jgi:hypothetical protein
MYIEYTTTLPNGLFFQKDCHYCAAPQSKSPSVTCYTYSYPSGASYSISPLLCGDLKSKVFLVFVPLKHQFDHVSQARHDFANHLGSVFLFGKTHLIGPPP